MTDKKKPKKSEKSIQFKFGGPDSSEKKHSTAVMVEELRGSQAHAELLNAELLQKSVKPLERMDLAVKVDKNKIAYSAYQTTPNSSIKKPFNRISDEEQKELAQYDPYISAIISKRMTQMAVLGRPSDSKFDKGTRLKDLNPPKREDFGTEKAYKSAVQARSEEMKKLLDWAIHCGYYEPTFLNSLFYQSDKMFKTCTLAEYIVAQGRNLLTFGRYARMVFRDEEGIPTLFRPMPVETIEPLYHYTDAYVSGSDETYPQSIKDVEAFNEIPKEERPHAYVQVIDGLNENFYTEDQVKVHYFQKQALWDLKEYPLSPIELAVYMVFIHQQTLGYIRNQFIKGIATKSFITIQTTDPNYKLDDESLDQLRREFHNYIMRTDNSAVTPILSGPIEVNVQSFHATPRDMEFLQLEDHIIRALCSAFQISPHEMGYGNLGASDGITQNSKEEEIIRGEEAGLRALLDIMYDDVNEIMSETFQGFRENYRLIYVGVGEDTRDAVIQRSISEIQTTATMNSLYADSDKNEVIPFGGDVPLSSSFHQNVISKMTYAEFRFHYLKDEKALQNPEYQFIIDPNLNQAWQGLRVTSIEDQQKQAKLQSDSMEMQMAGQQQQMQMQNQQIQQGVLPSGQEPDQEEQPEPTEKSMSLKDAYEGKGDDSQPLQKSMEYYFSSWIKSQEKD